MATYVYNSKKDPFMYRNFDIASAQLLQQQIMQIMKDPRNQNDMAFRAMITPLFNCIEDYQYYLENMDRQDAQYFTKWNEMKYFNQVVKLFFSKQFLSNITLFQFINQARDTDGVDWRVLDRCLRSVKITDGILTYLIKRMSSVRQQRDVSWQLVLLARRKDLKAYHIDLLLEPGLKGSYCLRKTIIRNKYAQLSEDQIKRLLNDPNARIRKYMFFRVAPQLSLKEIAAMYQNEKSGLELKEFLGQKLEEMPSGKQSLSMMQFAKLSNTGIPRKVRLKVRQKVASDIVQGGV